MADKQEIIHRAKAEFLRAKESIAHALATTPDDRVDWSPSPTSRTPIQVVAHAAGAVKNMHGNLEGQTFGAASPAEADKEFREWEQQFNTRDHALDLLEEHSAAYIAWLDDLTPDRLDSMVTLPFGMGAAPMTAALTFMPMHLNWHIAQIHYIQTIYGDHNWHM